MRGRMEGKKYRGLRIAWSVARGVAALLLIAIWIRSYWYVDTIALARSSVTWMQGFIFFDSTIELKPNAVKPWNRFGAVSTMSIWNLHGEGISKITGRFIQIGLIAPFVVALSALPWVQQRFSLRTLLVAMTLFAVLVGLGRWSASKYQRQLSVNYDANQQ